jgi:two-component sensor histidine kinase
MHANSEPKGSSDLKTGSEQAAKQVDKLLSSAELAKALESERFKHFLDNIPVAIVVAKITADGERIVYANLAFEGLSEQTAAWVIGDEAMTNAFKYAFPGRERGTITLRCLREDDRCSILVADDGVGLLPDASWPPPNKISTLIVQSLRENARTNVKVYSRPGEGTTITFAVPVVPPKAPSGKE